MPTSLKRSPYKWKYIESNPSWWFFTNPFEKYDIFKNGWTSSTIESYGLHLIPWTIWPHCPAANQTRDSPTQLTSPDEWRFSLFWTINHPRFVKKKKFNKNEKGFPATLFFPNMISLNQVKEHWPWRSTFQTESLTVPGVSWPRWGSRCFLSCGCFMQKLHESTGLISFWILLLLFNKQPEMWENIFAEFLCSTNGYYSI